MSALAGRRPLAVEHVSGVAVLVATFVKSLTRAKALRAKHRTPAQHIRGEPDWTYGI